MLSLLPIVLMFTGMLGLGGQDQVPSPATAASLHAAAATDLQTGGDNYLIRYTAGRLEATMTAMGGVVVESGSGNEAAGISRVDSFLRKAGFYGVQAVGFSTVPRQSGLKDLRMVLLRDAETASKPLWRALLGNAPTDRKLIGYLPANTAFVLNVTPDAEAIWSLYTEGALATVHDGNGERAAASLHEMSEKLGADVEQLLASIKDEFLIAVQVDQSARIPVPMGRTQAQIPTPSLLIAAKVVDDRIARFVSQKMSTPEAPWQKSQKGNMTIHTFPAPLSSPVPFQPALAYGAGVMLFGSTPDAVHAALSAAEAGDGLVAAESFRNVFGRGPIQANALHYSAPIFTETIHGLVGQMAKTNGGVNLGAMLGTPSGRSAGWTLTNAEDRVLLKGVGTGTTLANLFQGMGAQLPMIAGMAMPRMMQSRERARDAVCRANLRQIEFAKQAWAADNNPDNAAVPTEEDLKEYLGRALDQLKCPKGGTYTIGDMQTKPSCSVHGPAQ